MAHLRNRYAFSRIQKALTFSPIVGVLGHRQVGKTTMLEKLTPNYYALDRKNLRDECSIDPEKFLQTRHEHKQDSLAPIAFDECQENPELFTELKEWVRRNTKPGQFLLSGSVRFTSRSLIRESLTGRITYQEILPFSVPELLELPLSPICKDLCSSTDLKPQFLENRLRNKSEINLIEKHSQQYYHLGGLPGICFIRDEKIRFQKLSEYLTTMLDQDIRLTQNIKITFTEIKRVASALARQQGQPVDYTRIKNETNVSTPTIKKIILGLESIYIVRIIPILGTTKGFTVYFEDMAEHQALLDEPLTQPEQHVHFAYSQLRTSFHYELGLQTHLFQFRTRGGAIAPFTFSNREGSLGVFVVENVDKLPNIRGSIASYLQNQAKAKVLILDMSNASEPNVMNDRTLLAPISFVI